MGKKKFLSPLLSGRAVIVKENKILLVSSNKECWVVPGGIADEDETIEGCIKREIYEEIGLTVEVGDVVYVSEFLDDKYGSHKVELYFRAEVVAGEFKNEVEDTGDGVVKHADFFSLADIQSEKIKFYPEFLKLGEWLTAKANYKVYKGVSRRIKIKNH